MSTKNIYKYFLLPVLFTLLIGAIDAVIKGNVMAHYPDWDSVPWYFKDQYKIYPGFIALLFLGGGYLIAKKLKLNRTKFLVHLIILGASGIESLFYWLSIRLLRIPQPINWIPDGSFFDFYPEVAPWLNVFPWLNWLTPGPDVTRVGVILGSYIGISIVLILTILPPLIHKKIFAQK